MGLINLLTNLNSFYTDNPYHQRYRGSDSSTPPDAVARGSFDQKSLSYGNDRIHGGNSKQPYIQTPIPEKLGDFGVLDNDFILRGGSKAVTDSVKDVERLGKYFLDVRNPSGLLFVAKQNLLSRTAVRTQASGLLLNEGAYTPLSTLIEAGGVAFGLHVNKQGLNPFDGLDSIGKYEDKINREVYDAANSPDGILKNRLASLYESKIQNDELGGFVKINGVTSTDDVVNLISYKGGPGSTLGIGNTNIKFATGNGSNDVRTGVNNSALKNNALFFYGYKKHQSPTYFTLAGEYKTLPTDPYENLKRFLGLSIYPSIYDGYLRTSEEDNIIPSITSPTLEITTVQNGSYNTYSQKQLIDIPTSPLNGESSYIGGISSKNNNTTPGDFRALLRTPQSLTYDEIIGSLAVAPDYTKKNIEKRVNLGDPGNRSGKNLTSYVSGSIKGAASVSSYDKINALPIYQSNGPLLTKVDPKGSTITNDLVKFRIGVYDLTGDKNIPKNYIHFRAFLNNISDQYSAEWQATRYIGRGENFYTYAGFDRKVSLSWTVAAQSKAELIPMYKKLNYLASICAPDYSGHGYMRGNIVTLTIGGYFYEQPGIITGLSYEMNDDNATWEIGIPDKETTSGEFYDPSVKELPHLIKVSGFNFIPIHDFVPRLQQNSFGGVEPDNILKDNNGYGPERYIALANADGVSNYG